MRQQSPVRGGLPAVLAACAVLGAGLVAACQQESPRAPAGQGPAAAASPAAPRAEASPAAPAGGATAAVSPAGEGQQMAQARGGAAGQPPATPASIANGEKLFQQTCASCHGAQGKGDGPAAVALNPKPQDLTDDQWKHGGSPQQIFQTISTGVPGTAMVSWASIPEKDRWDLVNYVLSLKGK